MPLMHCDLLAVINGPCSPTLTRRWMAQIALGIHALHRMGIIHRDIKPENILLDAPDGNARVADLNAAYPTPGSEPLDGRSDAYCWGKKGSLPYMAYEITEGPKIYGTAVDWWALGCVMYDLVTGMLLFENEAVRQEYFQWNAKAKGMSYLAWRADLTGEEESVLCGLLDKSPCRRFRFSNLQYHTYFQDENHPRLRLLA
ncbi:kinase-like domain-containing protein [Trametes elegans]|nr:kinase-like domain-containing protein [Trametes elegans]